MPASSPILKTLLELHRSVENRGGLLAMPLSLLGGEVWRYRIVAPLMISVEPINLLRRHHLGNNTTLLNVAECEGLHAIPLAKLILAE